MLKYPCFLMIAFISSWASAAEPGFKNETSLGIVVTDGNSRTKSFNAQQMDRFAWDKNLFKFDGAFLKSVSNGAESARKWNLGIRYERELAELWSVFLGQNVESDIFAGYKQRYNTDLGAKYVILKGEETNWLSEAGYRYTRTNNTNGIETKDHYLRLYSEASQQMGKSVLAKLWLEYLPNLTVSTAWKFNSELSVSAMMSSIFSLKTAYLVQFDHEPAKVGAVKTDSTLTTSLVAKF